jgi:hypothetical protein
MPAAELSYLSFYLHILPYNNRFIALVKTSAGEVSNSFSLPFSELELETFMLSLSRPPLSTRSIETREMTIAREYGTRLFKTVFAGVVYDAYRRSQQEAARSGGRLRIFLNNEAVQLNSLPWEYLYDPNTDSFLSLSTTTPVIRYFPQSYSVRAPEFTLPLNILVVIASPSDLPALDIEVEWQILSSSVESLARRGIVKLDRLEDASLAALQRRLRRNAYHILHFVGHGTFDSATQTGALAFSDERGLASMVDGQTLGTLLADHQTMKLVVLDACEGARSSIEDPFNDVAQSLLRRGIPAVVGMQFALSDRTAQTFDQEFYSALLDGYPVDTSVTEARKAIFATGNTVEWGAPVVYTSVLDGTIFKLSPGVSGVQVPVIPKIEPEVTSEQQNRLEEIYKEAMTAYYLENWVVAQSYFRQIIELQSDYSDVKTRLQEIERRLSAEQLRVAIRYANERMPALISALARYTTLEQIGAAPNEFAWLPDSMLPNLEDDTREILPGLLRIARDIASIKDADLYGRRLGMRDMLTALESLEQQVSTLTPKFEAPAQPQLEPAAKGSLWEKIQSWLARPSASAQQRDEVTRLYARWLPVVNRWQQVILAQLKTLEQHTPAGEMENPYEVGTPLRLNRKALFKGRMALRDAVVIALRESSRPTLVLHGPRRMGKTSFLLQLPALLPGKTIPVFIDLQRPAMTSSDSAFFYSLARAITEGAKPYLINIPNPVRERFDERPYEAFDIWLYDIVVPRLQDNNLLLCMDEFEKAGQALDAKKLTSGVLDELRSLIQHQEKMAVLFAGVQTLDELGPNWSSYFINVRSLTIGYLETREAEELIRNPDPEVEFPLKYQDEAVADILADTLGHPYLLQLVCSCIVEQANQHRTTRADTGLVEAGKKMALERGQPYFRNIWDEMAGPEGQLLLRQAASSGVVHLTPSGSAQRQALERMVQLRVLRKSSNGYSVEVPLVARWVNEYAPD